MMQLIKDYNYVVGRNLKRIRVESGVSMLELGNAIGVSFQQVQKYERGSNRVSSGLLRWLSLFFNKTVEDFYVCDWEPDEKFPDRSSSKQTLRIIGALNKIADHNVLKRIESLILCLAGVE